MFGGVITGKPILLFHPETLYGRPANQTVWIRYQQRFPFH
jgi:hypothetical protein